MMAQKRVNSPKDGVLAEERIKQMAIQSLIHSIMIAGNDVGLIKLLRIIISSVY